MKYSNAHPPTLDVDAVADKLGLAGRIPPIRVGSPPGDGPQWSESLAAYQTTTNELYVNWDNIEKARRGGFGHISPAQERIYDVRDSDFTPEATIAHELVHAAQTLVEGVTDADYMMDLGRNGYALSEIERDARVRARDLDHLVTITNPTQ